MLQTLKRLLGLGPAPAVNLDPFQREAQQKAPAAQIEAAATRREALPAVVREELLDARTRIAGYRFSTAWSTSSEAMRVKASLDALKRENLAALQ